VRARILFLDDSGKPDPKHASGAVVIAGFAIDADLYPTLSRRLLGAKRRFYPHRGLPQDWEVKSSQIVKPNEWKRGKNRDFAAEVVRIVEALEGTAFAATIVKSRMKHEMTLATTTPLQLQCLVEHFDAECRTLDRVGMVVSDWSTYRADEHTSRSVASFVASRRKMTVHPCVYYAGSQCSEGIQVADLIAGVRQRAEDGDERLQDLDRQLASIRACCPQLRTVGRRRFKNWITLF